MTVRYVQAVGVVVTYIAFAYFVWGLAIDASYTLPAGITAFCAAAGAFVIGFVDDIRKTHLECNRHG